MFCKKGVHKNFTKFTGKQLCLSLLFNKARGRNFIKKETQAKVFSVNFVKFLRSFFYRTFPVAASLAPVIVDEHYNKVAGSSAGAFL